MPFSYSGWLTPLPAENHPPQVEIPATGQYELTIPGHELPVVLHWRSGYQPQPSPHSGLSAAAYAKVAGYPAAWSSSKVGNDDLTRCTFTYGDRPLTLNLTADQYTSSHSGHSDQDHLDEFEVAELPCHSLVNQIHRGVPISTYFEYGDDSDEPKPGYMMYYTPHHDALIPSIKRRKSCWNLMGERSACLFYVKITYSFDLENLSCHYFHDYFSDQQP